MGEHADAIVTGAICIASSIFMSGGLWVQVAHLKEGLSQCVQREVYAAQQEAHKSDMRDIKEALRDIKAELRRTRDHEDTGSHRMPRLRDDE